MKNCIYFDELESTNIYAKSEAKKGAPEGTVIIAGRQSGGYGRMRRSFFSPEGTGLYMSVILRPELHPEKSLYITTAAAVAVAEAIEELSGKKADIKWVNDIYINGKKVCGILTEAAFTSENNIDHAVLGIGINLTEPKGGFEDSIKDIAGAVFEKADESMRFVMAERILEKFYRYYASLEDKGFWQSYRDRCFLIGSTVRVISAEGEYSARVTGIDGEFGLIVEADGKKNILRTGEVSIKV